MTTGTAPPPRTSLRSSHVESPGYRRRPPRRLRWRKHCANTNTNVNADAGPDDADCDANTVPDAGWRLFPDQRWDR